MFWQLRKLLRRSAATAPSLWSAASDPDDQAPPIEFTEPDTRQIAQREMDLLGFPITLDPLTFLGRDDKGREIDWSRYVPVDQLDRHLRRRVAVCGLMVADRINATQSGDLMKFVTLADRTGFIEAILFPDAYRRFGHMTVANPILAAVGIVEPFENGNGFILRVQQVSPPQRRLKQNSPDAANKGILVNQSIRRPEKQAGHPGGATRAD
jgi:DNA polymerase III alpha subunit